MGKAIGIDLGTTNSCAAVMDGNRPRVITQRGGTTTIPSVFAIDDKGNRLVGHEAKRQAQLNPSNTVMAAKRLIGRNFHSKTIDKVRQVFTYEMLEGDNSEVLIKVKDQVFTLEQISAAILRRIKEVAEDSLGGEVDQAVITVPAYFNDRQRQAVRNAGKLAGLKVLRILNEPTAAALAYGLGKNLSQRIAVYDLGGGTFDISVIDIKDRIFEVIATGGDTFLGGVDFDDRMMQYVLEEFHQRHGIDLAWDRVAIQRIRDAAEAAKIELSTKKVSRIHIPYIAKGEDGPLDVDMEVTREKLEELTGDLVRRTIDTCDRIFKEAGTGATEVDEVLLVGGQSRMPLVQQVVTEFAGRPPSKGVHPDEAVAIGAAIMAHSLANTSANDVTLLDVLPMPIGINKRDGAMHVLFQKNQPLPDYKTRMLTTSKDDQRSIMLRIYQGESRIATDNELLGTFVFSGIRPAPKGKVQIEVTFHIDSEGILNLSARDQATGQTVESTLKLSMGKDKDEDGTEKPEKAEKPAASKPAASKPAAGKPTATDEVAATTKAPLKAPALGMPRSSLATDIGGGAPPPAVDDERTAMASAPPDRLNPVNLGAQPSASPTPTPTPPAPAPEAPKGDIGEELARARETALARKTGEPPGAKPPPGVFARMMGWFKGLFGG